MRTVLEKGWSCFISPNAEQFNISPDLDIYSVSPFYYKGQNNLEILQKGESV